LISKRAKGELPTAARWIRDTVTSHPLYKGDAVASNAVIADLLKRCEDIGMGRETCTSLYGDVKMEPVVPELSYEIPLSTVLPTEPPAKGEEESEQN
jgi:glutamate--cysteine ligase catalytic subunit